VTFHLANGSFAGADKSRRCPYDHPWKDYPMKKILALAAGFALLSSAAFAQAAPSDFATVDADASGDVTLAEANTLWPDLTQEAYAAADTNGDGKVDQAEYEAFLAANPAAQ
jgi:hypothetical protein